MRKSWWFAFSSTTCCALCQFHSILNGWCNSPVCRPLKPTHWVLQDFASNVSNIKRFFFSTSNCVSLFIIISITFCLFKTSLVSLWPHLHLEASVSVFDLPLPKGCNLIFQFHELIGCRDDHVFKIPLYVVFASKRLLSNFDVVYTNSNEDFIHSFILIVSPSCSQYTHMVWGAYGGRWRGGSLWHQAVTGEHGCMFSPPEVDNAQQRSTNRESGSAYTQCVAVQERTTLPLSVCVWVCVCTRVCPHTVCVYQFVHLCMHVPSGVPAYLRMYVFIGARLTSVSIFCTCDNNIGVCWQVEDKKDRCTEGKGIGWRGVRWSDEREGESLKRKSCHRGGSDRGKDRGGLSRGTHMGSKDVFRHHKHV